MILCQCQSPEGFGHFDVLTGTVSMTLQEKSQDDLSFL